MGRKRTIRSNKDKVLNKLGYDAYTVGEIETLLKQENITMDDFKKSLGRFCFRFTSCGQIIIERSDVLNTISRINLDRKRVTI